ncbi:hypothetical protein BT69DRAFT_586203 [Atractiella rhizophila]|nr:hypothetical protein BT69DRAFT_586203 [Atractiella rhizophila]
MLKQTFIGHLHSLSVNLSSMFTNHSRNRFSYPTLQRSLRQPLPHHKLFLSSTTKTKTRHSRLKVAVDGRTGVSGERRLRQRKSLCRNNSRPRSSSSIHPTLKKFLHQSLSIILDLLAYDLQCINCPFRSILISRCSNLLRLLNIQLHWSSNKMRLRLRYRKENGGGRKK